MSSTANVSSDGFSLSALSPEEQARLVVCRSSIEQGFAASPSEAVRRFDDALAVERPMIGKALMHTMGSRFEWIGKASSVREGTAGMTSLALAHGSASSAQRRLLIRYAIDELIALSVASKRDAGAKGILEQIALGLKRFVLDGTVEQQLVCKLAIHIGIKFVPPDLLECIGDALLNALITILEVGAPATRDSAVEGLGAIVKLMPARAHDVPDLNDATDDPNLDERANKINASYVRRRQRQRLTALAIAGIGNFRKQLFDSIESPADDDLDHRAQFLRILPAVWRQRHGLADADAVLTQAIHALRNAAMLRDDRTHGSQFARYQESVFQTISVMVDRSVDPDAFDDVVASALKHLPPTLTGSATDSNAYVRATVAVIGAAARIATHKRHSACERSLRPIFEVLASDQANADSVWSNPGIFEGCLHSLPLLLAKSHDGSWVVPALAAVLRYLQPPFALRTDLVAVHRRLSSIRCLRRVIVALMEVRHRARHEQGDDPQETVADRDDDGVLAQLLANPTAAAFFNAFQNQSIKRSLHLGITPHWLSPLVIGGADFDAVIRRQLSALFHDWDRTTDAGRLLLTRILANQLRNLSHDARQIAWYPALQRRIEGLPGHVADEDHERALMDVLSNIPSAAADAADADLQDFLRHRSRRAGTTNDLPRYVLAMISETVSYRLATEIARSVDLSFRRALLTDSDFDLAIFLYHVMLHGPDRAIYYHLLPRMKEKHHYDLVCLFADHVHNVRGCHVDEGGYRDRLKKLLEHIRDFLPKLRPQRSDLLSSLSAALTVYCELGNDATTWFALQGKKPDASIIGTVTWKEGSEKTGGFHQLLRQLDEMAAATDSKLRTEMPAGKVAPVDRSAEHKLADDCEDECAALLSKVRHYIDLSVDRFDDRRATLEQATALAAQLREKLSSHKSLHPPERVLLTVLLATWEEMFRQTIEWFVEAPRRCIETTKPRLFWQTFVTRPADKLEVQNRDALRDGIMGRPRWLLGSLFDEFFERNYDSPDDYSPPLRLGLTGPKPPEKPHQNREFEAFYVAWMSSELDVDHMAWALRSRWTWFKPMYFFMTNIWLCLAVIAAPFLLTIITDIVDTEFSHEIAGAGFFLYAAGVLIVGGFVLTGGVRRRTASWIRKRFDRKNAQSPSTSEEERPRLYIYQSALPRLLRLIVVPLALIVDFDHSYYFPTHASNVVILLLMGLAFLTTNYFVTMELRHRAREVSTPEEKRRMGSRRHVHQIVSIALAHSFVLSLIFSIIFEANTIKRFDAEEHRIPNAPPSHAKSEPILTVPKPLSLEPSLSVRGRRWLLQRFDTEGEYFFGVLPRRTSFDFGRCLDRWLYLLKRRHLHDSVLLHLRFDYYPTLILCWTALGLFFGVFLEGFLKGESLREK